MEEVEMPDYVDSQPQLFFWELDEVIVYVLTMIVGIITRELTIMLIVGFVIVYIFSGWKMKQLDGILAHLAFHWGVLGLNKVFRNGNVKEYVE